MNSIMSQKNALCPPTPGQVCAVPRSMRLPPSQVEYGILRYAVKSYQFSPARHWASASGSRGDMSGSRTHSPSSFLT